ncbi:MAG: biotin attachment protein, partial [Zobellia laminariae]
GKIVAVETFIDVSGKYRVLVAPDDDPEAEPWPKDIRVGSGANTISLLDDVPIWFELWRQINGFPPNYYQPKETTAKKEK